MHNNNMDINPIVKNKQKKSANQRAKTSYKYKKKGAV